MNAIQSPENLFKFIGIFEPNFPVGDNHSAEKRFAELYLSSFLFLLLYFVEAFFILIPFYFSLVQSTFQVWKKCAIPSDNSRLRAGGYIVRNDSIGNNHNDSFMGPIIYFYMNYLSIFL